MQQKNHGNNFRESDKYGGHLPLDRHIKEDAEDIEWQKGNYRH